MFGLKKKKRKFSLCTLNLSPAPYDKLAKIYTNCSGHMTKIADIPIYGKKTFKIFFSRTRGLMTFGLGMYI